MSSVTPPFRTGAAQTGPFHPDPIRPRRTWPPVATLCLALGALLALFGPAYEDRCFSLDEQGASAHRSPPFIPRLDATRHVDPPACPAFEDVTVPLEPGHRLVLPGFVVSWTGWAAISLIPVSAVAKVMGRERSLNGRRAMLAATSAGLTTILALAAVVATAEGITSFLALESSPDGSIPTWINSCSGRSFRWADWPWAGP